MNQSKTHRLLDIGGRLWFPTGGDPWGVETGEASLLMVVYQPGECDTCRWPMVDDVYTVAEQRAILARALFDERETNDTFAYKDQVELPDGTPFWFDEELVQAERAGRIA